MATSELHGLDTHKSQAHHKRGAILFHEGAPCQTIYCVFDGKIKIYKTGADGSETILRIAKRGDVLGYHSFLSGHGYIANAMVIEDATVCGVDHRYFNQLLAKSPAVAISLIQKLGDEVRDSFDRINDMQNLPVRQRFANLLLTLSRVYGCDELRGRRLDLRLSRAELASMIATTPETVIRLLRDFSDHRYLILEGKQIILSNVQGLLETSAIDL